MKKRFLIILGIVMVLGLVGCGKKAISEGSSEETTIEIEDTETVAELEVISKDNKTFKTTDNKSNSKAVNNKNEAHSNTTQGYKSNTASNTNANNSISTGNTGYAVSDCSVDNSYTESNNAPVSNNRTYYPESYINYMNNPNSSSGSSNSPSTSTHVHNYSEPIYGEDIIVVDIPEWEEPICQSGMKCSTCQEVFFNGEELDTHQHILNHHGWTEYEMYITGYIHHNEENHSEKNIIGYKCSCGDIYYF